MLGQHNKQNQVVQTINPTGFQPFPSSLHLYRLELSLKKMSPLLVSSHLPLPSVSPVVKWSITFETFIYGKCISAKGSGETLIFPNGYPVILVTNNLSLDWGLTTAVIKFPLMLRAAVGMGTT